MHPKLTFGIMKKFIPKLISYFKNLHPKYNLSLDHHFYDLGSKKIIYCFKVFGDHSFVQFGFDDIKKNKNLLHEIHPVDLMKITTENYVLSQQKNTITIVETLRDNKYKLSDSSSEEFFSGDEICDNILLIEKIKNIDLYKIAYNTGFNHGRQLAREINKKSEDAAEKRENVVALHIVEQAHSR